jgi:hypothetical protein
MRMAPVVLVLAACGPAGRDTPATDAPSQVDSSTSDAPDVDSSRVYAHSGQTLYLMDSVTLATTTVGSFTGLGTQSLTDLAIDKSDRMIGVTLDRLFEIDPTTGATSFIADLSGTGNATSLSFVPADLDDPGSADLLVTADSFGRVFRIDTQTGQTTQIGDYGTVPAGKVRSSGDLFGVRGVGIYATVDIGDGSAPSEDFLARIDPVTWKATPLGVGTGYDKIFGLGYWGGKIYGFVDAGQAQGGRMIQIDINTGGAIELAQTSARWFGAGVATDAPIL